MRALLSDTITGAPLRDLKVTGWEFDNGINAPVDGGIVVPAFTKWARSINLRDELRKYDRSLVLIDEDVAGVETPVAAGPISVVNPRDHAKGRHNYQVKFGGLERLLEYRHVRLAPGWSLLNASNLPTGIYDQILTGLSYGTMMKRIVEESTKFPGGGLPLNYEPDRSGSHERTALAAIDGRKVADVLNDLADLEDGVEYDFRPVLSETSWLSYDLVTGTDSGRVITGASEWLWNLGGPRPDVVGWSPKPSSEPRITDAIFAGGKDGDKVLLARAFDHSSIAAGGVRAEVWDTSHSSVSVQATLASWAARALGEQPESPSFDVRLDQARTLRHGDLATVVAEGHWNVPDGEHPVRILGYGRQSSAPGWVNITLV